MNWHVFLTVIGIIIIMVVLIDAILNGLIYLVVASILGLMYAKFILNQMVSIKW